jgi:hypothetical protein
MDEDDEKTGADEDEREDDERDDGDEIQLNVYGLKELHQAAEAGDDSAVTLLACMLYRGWFQEKNLAEAFRLYLVAAERGDGPSMCQVAYMLEHGEGCEPDPAQAAQWYAKAAQKGFHGPEARADAKVWDVDGGE